MVRIFDPRSSNSIQAECDSHQNIKDSRILWLGEQPRLLTTGFDAARIRQVIIRDIRNLSVPEKVLELDCSTGILMPLFDPDTNMLFLAGKGDTTINYMEVTDKDPYLIEGLRHTGEQTKGACLIPKRALKVMEGEVNRVLQLTSNMVIPIMYQVPRKVGGFFMLLGILFIVKSSEPFYARFATSQIKQFNRHLFLLCMKATTSPLLIYP